MVTIVKRFGSRKDKTTLIHLVTRHFRILDINPLRTQGRVKLLPPGLLFRSLGGPAGGNLHDRLYRSPVVDHGPPGDPRDRSDKRLTSKMMEVSSVTPES